MSECNLLNFFQPQVINRVRGFSGQPKANGWRMGDMAGSAANQLCNIDGIWDSGDSWRTDVFRFLMFFDFGGFLLACGHIFLPYWGCEQAASLLVAADAAARNAA